MEPEKINQTFGKYYKYSLWLVAAATLISLLFMNIYSIPGLVNSLVVCVIYTFIVNLLYGVAWKGVAKSSPGMLTKFYLTAPVLRMVTAATVVVAYCLLNRGNGNIRNFVLLFFVFYVVMLIFDGIFFARVEKKNNHKE